jgi:hypothetical protein
MKRTAKPRLSDLAGSWNISEKELEKLMYDIKNGWIHKK